MSKTHEYYKPHDISPSLSSGSHVNIFDVAQVYSRRTRHHYPGGTYQTFITRSTQSNQLLSHFIILKSVLRDREIKKERKGERKREREREKERENERERKRERERI